MWIKQTNFINGKEIGVITISPNDPSQIFIGTDTGIYKSTDSGRVFKLVLHLARNDVKVNSIYISADERRIFACSDAALYVSEDLGNKWQKIERAKSEQRFLSVYETQETIYLGASDGLYNREKGAKTFEKIRDGIGDKAVNQIIGDGENIYLATNEVVYKIGDSPLLFSETPPNKNLKNNRGLSPIFSAGIEKLASEETEESKRLIKYITYDAENSRLILAAENGIYISQDHGDKWEKLSSVSTISENITSILPVKEEENLEEDNLETGNSEENNSENNSGISSASHGSSPVNSSYNVLLLVGTYKGAYFLKDGRLTPVFRGMETSNVKCLAKGDGERIFAGTDKGLYAIGVRHPLSVSDTDNGCLTPIEPSIRQVQQMAIDYADVSNAKVSDWRARARKKAWLPSFSVGFDGDKNRTIGNSVWGTYSGGGQSYVGPNDKTFYDNMGFDVSMSWDLGDVIFSDDETSIDSRAKMMVELREDILDQVTRIYFERKNLRVEIATNDYEEYDRQTLEMRVDELTALLDGYTGGGFSREVEKLEAQKSEEQKTINENMPAAVRMQEKEENHD